MCHRKSQGHLAARTALMVRGKQIFLGKAERVLKILRKMLNLELLGLMSSIFPVFSRGDRLKG